MVDETVLGGIVLGLERTEEGLLRAEDLNSRSRVLGQVHQATSMGDESGTDQLADQSGEVGGDGLHPTPEVLGQLGAVLGDGDDLVAERVDVSHVGVGDLGTHGQLGGGLDGGFELLGEDQLERGGSGVGSEAWIRVSTVSK